MEVIEARRKLREQVARDASSWAAELPFRLTAILVGSYARGDFNLWSDIDILLVSEDFEGGPVERLKALDTPPGFQVIPLTPNEFRRLLDRGDHLAVEAVESGLILRDDLKIQPSTFTARNQ